MKAYVTAGTLLVLVSTSIYAQEVEEKRDRINSVRKVVDKVGKIQPKEVSEADKVHNMFSDGKFSGQLRMMYSEDTTPDDVYATAIGGMLKYELAEYHGFNAGVAFYTSNDIPFASGDGVKRYTDLSSSDGETTDMSEAYINYKYKDLNLRAGRQILDTPLADSDDYRMIQNTFEAYVATYNFNDIELMAGHISSWHGTDAGLDDKWIDTGSSGVNFGGITYGNGLEYSAWYYNITGMTNAAYFELGYEYEIDKNFTLHTAGQYLHESELDDSGVEASIYGGLVELVAYDIGLNISFDKSQRRKDKASFSGFGGGTLFTNMDTMIIDEITQDADALAVVAGVSYEINKFGFLYAYGDFSTTANEQIAKSHVVEQDLGGSYNFSEELVLAALYSHYTDKEDSLNDWNRLQVMLSYNF